MKTEENKMQWLIDRVVKGEMENIIEKTGEKKGSIVIPTGCGKSGHIYEDIIYHINNMKEDDKFIFNISAPILLLEAQCVNDLMNVLSVVFKERIDNGEFMFFINSSDGGDAYICDKIFADANRFDEIEKFEKNPNAKVAIVASCHKSLIKFSKEINNLTSYATVFNYLDESHLLKTDEEIEETDSITGETIRKNSLNEIFSKSDYVYTLTATEDEEVHNFMKEHSKKEYIINRTAKEYIEKNIILPVHTQEIEIDSSEEEYNITPSIAIQFMDNVIKDNPYINHKLLITCSDTQHLINLKNSLTESGYKVFSTCAKEGAAEDFGDIDEIDFINIVDNYDGNCFVLHIKRLCQGIDIKTLTDCIIYNGAKPDDSLKRRIIQIIGRVLRAGKNERGLPEEKRLKKYGNVLFVIGGNCRDEVKNRLSHLILSYYGKIGNKIFKAGVRDDIKGHGRGFTIGEEVDCPYSEFLEYYIESLKTNICKYIDEHLRYAYEFEKEFKPSITSEKFMEKYGFTEIRKKFLEHDKEENLDDLMSNEELMNYMNKVLEEIK